jgi:hypothetical protein
MRLVRYSLYGFVIFLVVPFYSIYNVYFPPESHLIAVGPLATYLLLACDTGFSLTLLLLFVYPFKWMARESSRVGSGSDKTDAYLQRVMKNNLKLSATMVCVTFVTMTYTSQLYALCDGLPRIDNLDLQYYRVLSQMCVTLDILINTICARLITNFWMPQKLHHALFPEHKSSHELSNSITVTNMAQHKTDDDDNSFSFNSPTLVSEGGVSEGVC